MKREDALKELQRIGVQDENGDKPVIGTPELRAQFYYLDEWNQRYPDFNPVKLVALEEEGGYSWHFYAVFRNINKAFVLVTGSGCSCNNPGESCDLEFFKDVDSTLYNLRNSMDSGSDYARELYRQTLTWVATSGQRSK